MNTFAMKKKESYEKDNKNNNHLMLHKICFGQYFGDCGGYMNISVVVIFKFE